MCFLGLRLIELPLPIPYPSRISHHELQELVQWFCLRVRSRARTFSTQRSNCPLSVACIRSNFVIFPSDHKMLKLNALPCILFPSARVGRDTNSSTSSGSTMVKILFFTRIPTRPFLLLSNRIDNTKSQLLREQ